MSRCPHPMCVDARHLAEHENTVQHTEPQEREEPLTDRSDECCTYRRAHCTYDVGGMDSNGTEHLRFENSIALL